MTPLVIIRGGAAAGLLAVCCRAQRRPQQREYTPRETKQSDTYTIQLQALWLVSVMCKVLVLQDTESRPRS
jgi:hypothetical protein